MKKVSKLLMFSILLGFILLVPGKVSAKQTNTSSIYYLYAGRNPEYEGQKTLVIMESIEDNNENIFNMDVPVMPKVTKIIFSDQADEIPHSLASKCPNVEEIEICKDAQTCGFIESFNDSAKLKTITVDPESQSFKAIDNVLYSYNYESLLVYPKMKTDSTYIMPDGLTYDNNALDCNKYLKKITLSPNYFFTNSRFMKLPNLQEITVADGNEYYKTIDGVLYSYDMTEIYNYPNGKTNTTYTMPSTIKSDYHSFGTNKYLKKITLSKSFNMKKLNTDSGITELPNLESITVPAGNSVYKTKNGVLYSHNMNTLVYYPNGKKDKTYTVPSTVTKLSNSFGPNKIMKTLVIGKKVSVFEQNNGHVSLPNLTSIKVPTSNKYFKAYNGTLFTHSYKTLVYCARGKSKPYKVKAGTRKISDHAFDNCKITKITLPTGLKVMAGAPFASTKIKSIVLPASIEKIGNFTSGMHSLTSLTMKSGCKNYKVKDGILYTADYKIVSWPEKCHPKDFYLGSSANFMNFGIYENTKYIQTLHIGKNVTSISQDYFENNLKKIVLDSKNTSFKLYDGVLYNSDYTRIVLYPNKNTDTTITLHKNLKKLAQDSFNGTNNTKVLTLPEGLEEIETSYTAARENKYAEAGKESEYTYGRYDADIKDDEIDWMSLQAFTRSPFQNLSKLNLSDSNTHFTLKDNVLYSKDMTELVWYPIARENAEYTLPETVTKLNAQLREMSRLRKLTVNSTVKSTLSYLGTFSESLESIVVPENHPSYVSTDGILYNKDMTMLVVYPSGKKDTSYVMPESVTHARFTWSNKHLQELTLSSNLKSIGLYPDMLTDVYNENYLSTGFLGGFEKLTKVNGLRNDIKLFYYVCSEV